jgi:hypothetical protein
MASTGSCSRGSTLESERAGRRRDWAQQCSPRELRRYRCGCCVAEVEAVELRRTRSRFRWRTGAISFASLAMGRPKFNSCTTHR